MIQEASLPFLTNWQNFYMIIGSAAATLTGLMFVATTLIAGLERHVSTLDAGISAFNTPMDEEDLAIAQQVYEMAEARGLPMAQVAIARMLTKPVVTSPIIGATRMNHLDDAAAAVAVKLTPEETQHLETSYQPHPVLGYT